MNATVAVIQSSLKDWVTCTWSWVVKDSKVVLHFVTYIFIPEILVDVCSAWFTFSRFLGGKMTPDKEICTSKNSCIEI